MAFEDVYAKLMTQMVKVRLVAAVSNLSEGLRAKEVTAVRLHTKLFRTMGNVYIARQSLLEVLDEIEDFYPVDPEMDISWSVNNQDTVQVFFEQFINDRKTSVSSI